MGRSLAFDAVWVFAMFLALGILAAAVIAIRRYLLERGGGTMECGLRKPARTGQWRLGVASYQLDELRWFSVFGISPRPEEIFGRRELTVVSRRPPDAAEVAALGPGQVVAECSVAGAETVELALAETALTGLLAWLEAAPGSHPA